MKTKKELQKKRARRVRAKIRGSSARPRLSFFRSNTALYAQVIDDEKGKTIMSAHIQGKNIEAAATLGKTVVEGIKKHGLATVVFDRGGHRYHGSVQTFADSVREGGIKF